MPKQPKFLTIVSKILPKVWTLTLGRFTGLAWGFVGTLLLLTLVLFTPHPIGELKPEPKQDIAAIPEIPVVPSSLSPKSEPPLQMPLDLAGIFRSIEDLTKFNKEKILTDKDSLIDEEFAIPEDLHDRVSFWFDVYTIHDSNHRIIHHARYPWIVYKVVDVTEIINASKPKARWMRNQKADRLVADEVRKIKLALQSLSHKKDLSHLRDEEQLVSAVLERLPGQLRKRAAEASSQVRVQTGQKDYFSKGLIESAQYLPRMNEIFKAKHIPVELARLPFVESSFNRAAESKVGASGIWQFVGNTGKKFMIVDHSIDERQSPFKATEAAAKLLKENHLITGHSWPLAVTAFNHGPAGVKRAAKFARTKNLATIIEKYRTRNFRFATANYYCEFLAALYAETYQKEIFGDLKTGVVHEIAEISLSKALRVNQVLSLTGLNAEEFLQFNPDLKKAMKHNTLLPRGFHLHFPADVGEDFARILTELEAPPRKTAQNSGTRST